MVEPNRKHVEIMTKKGIYAPIYKIDTNAATEFFGGDAKIDDLPSLMIEKYNKDKKEIVFKSEGATEISGCKFDLYRNIKAQPTLSAWVHFFDGSGIELAKIQNQMQHLACFVVVDEELYAYTAGQAAVVFERYVDISFPIEVGRRIAKPEVKGARSSQITGDTLASDVHFRDPRRITYTESLENVWTALSGEIRSAVLGEKDLLSIFGPKPKIGLDVTSSIKLGPRIETPNRIIMLIRWLAMKAEAELPEDDGWAGLDAIKVLNPRKKKDLITRLKDALAEKIFVEGDYTNLAISHVDASRYNNATSYLALQDKNKVYEEDVRPGLADIVDKMEIDAVDLQSNFTAVTIQTENADYGIGHGTSGSLIGHLHGEVRYDGKTYFLLAGKWYEVDAVYVEQITKDFLNIISNLDLDSRTIGMRDWIASESEGVYNKTSVVTDAVHVNGDGVLTDNIELFDSIICHDKKTYLIHVKRDFDVKVRDVRSQIINAAQVIENDIRNGTKAKLKVHHTHLLRRGRTELSEPDFLAMFEHPRVYVLAYGSDVKVSNSTLDEFGSNIARMEIVSLNNQFRQISSSDSEAQLRISWIRIVE